MDSDSDDFEGTSVVPRVNRFKHQSYKKSLKEVHLPSALDLTKFDHDIPDNESHFYLALQQWRQLNLSPAFIQFAKKVDPLSISMPLLLHNWKEIIDLWKGALDASDHEALKALLDLLDKLAHDLRTTLAPSYADLLEVLLRLLPQPIPAPSLTALLATLSGLFRYLLVPSINLDLLDQTWSSFRAVLPTCNSDVQRAAAEVWGSVLRRLKSVARERAVILMAKNPEGVEDASAWMIVFACKSISQTLHTSAGSLMATLIDCHLTSDYPDLSYTLLRRVLTALIHHCNGSEHFSVVASLIVDRFCAVSQAEGANQQQLQRAMQITSVVCAVRQGSRLSRLYFLFLRLVHSLKFSPVASHLTQLASRLGSLPFDALLHPEILSFASSLLAAGDMVMTAGPGRAFVARALSVPSFGLMLCGVLAELGWGGWKLVGLPALLKATPSLLQAEPSLTLRLLASLQNTGKLGEVDIVFKRSVDGWIQYRLSTWEVNEESVDDLYNILGLSVFVDSLAPLLVHIIERSLNTSTPEEDWQTSHANAAWVIGTCMQALSRCKSSSWETQVDLSVWTTEVVDHWSWSAKVLMGLVALLETSPSTSQSLPIAQLYSRLQSRLLSPSRPLRLNVLGLLTSKMVKSSPAEHDALKRCLQGEEVSLDMHGVRERVLRIGRLYQVVRDDEPLSADICVRWLVSQLKVNLRPIWSPASEALSSLAQRFGNLVWDIIFSELQQPQGAQETPKWLTAIKDDENDMDPWEEERSWRDPTAHKLRGAAANWLDKHHHRKIIISEQKSSDRFDPVAFEAQVLLTLGQCTSLAEKHNRELVTYFLSIAGPDALSRLPKYKLQSWLTLFSKFGNPKALHSTDTLRELYRSLISYPDRALQTVSLSCLLAYKSPHLQHHEEKLRLLLDETKWRDELTSLHLSSIEIKDRPQLVDVIVRLLYGLMLERKGRSRGSDRRAAVLTALAGCTDEELSLLVDLMLKPMQSDSHACQDDMFSLRNISSDVSLKQQSGYLTLLGDVLKNLGSRLTTYWPALLGTTLDLVAHAQKQLSNVTAAEAIEQVENEADEEESEVGEVVHSRALRSVRQQGLKRLADFFRCPVEFDFTPYLSASFSDIVAPRLELLDQENTQAPSALMELFYIWTSRPEYSVHLVQHDPRVLPKILDCLVAANVKPAVINRVFDIVERLLLYSADDSQFLDLLIQPHISQLLRNLTTLVERTKADAALSSPITQRQISILSEVARYAADSTQALTLLGLLSPLLRKSSRIISEKVKVKLLSTLGHIFPLLTELSNSSSIEFSKAYELLSQLFMSLRFTASRLALTSAFNQLSVINPSIQELASLLESLNACSSKRIDEPDFNRRLTAFTLLNEQKYATLSCREWLPVLSNALYFVQDPEELAIRNNAAFTIRRFIDLTCDPSNPEFETLLMRTALPALKNALKSKHELVRAESLGVISYAVSKCDRISSLQEMRPLLAGGDEEASFFTNIHHIQIHRRTRALRRLAEYCDEGAMRSRTLVEVFLPLVEHYIVPTASLDHLLVSEAINTIGRIAKYLGWSAYSTLVHKYIRSSKDKSEGVRVYVRALVAILENFHFSVEDAVQHVDPSADDIANSDHEGLIDELHIPSADKQETKKIADAVHTRLLPSLLAYLSNRDETEDTLRIPISMGIAKVALHLPSASRDMQVGKLLTVLSQILRSRSQETRDLVRDTICRIAIALGSPYLPVLLRELRAALLRGPQLHILAFVFHAVLTHVTSAQGSNDPAIQDLDDCAADIAHVSAEVVFGESGKDVQHEDFRTKMREVRSSSSKGLDCFGLTARYVSPKRISALLLPLRSIIAETGSFKILQQVDEVLRRIASGLNSNARLTPAELLVLCNTLISQNAKFLQEVTKPKKKSNKKADAIVSLQRRIVTDTDHYTNNSFRFVVFGLELFNTAFRRSRFDFQDKQIISRLDPLVKLIGNALYSSSEPVLIASFKASASILRCPLNSVSSSAPVIARQILAIVRSTGSGESEVAQAGLKALASILRECEAAQAKEKDLLFLIEFVSPYLEDPDRQGTVFALLKAVVARRLIVPELYDVMADVSAILVTSQSAQTRESARSLLLQFLLDYPQGSGRLQTTLGFFARNLSYEHASGRSSVLELLGALVSKFDSALLEKHAEMIFVALVLCLANDEDKSCREASASVLQSLVKRLGEGERKVFVGHLHAWASQQGQEKLRAVAVQVYGLIIDALQREASPHAAALFADVQQILDNSIRSLTLSDGDGEDMDVDVEWQPPYQAILAVSKLLQTLPEHTLDAVKCTQDKLIPYLLFPHAWVRTAACRLFGVFFAFHGPTPTLENSHLTLQLMKDIAEKLCTQLKSPHLDANLGLQIVKNLFFVGKLFCTVASSSSSGSNTNDTAEAAETESDGGESDDSAERPTQMSPEKRSQDPLPWLFSKLSYQARSAHIARRNRGNTSSQTTWSLAPLSILRFFAAMASHMPDSQLERFLPHILTPVYRITEDDTIRDAGMEELKVTATELLDLLQNKVGTTIFANTYNRIRQGASSIQQERRVARATKATTNPEATAKRKLARNAGKKESRKRKNRAFADSRGRLKRRREEE
ncbi:armadillo-type protein [Suillus paluster]|uniref:armadillo-type protein n=1 Tax=Suillus paluster TaxID=48578 RepID=UPI001B875E61|nr:armadillo-type protein [Suillus paluster]KAG1731833.1 armadillo-type protein [Suillus paluster]